MITLHLIRLAFACGRDAGRAEAIALLRAQADLHRGHPGDHHRRGALNHAADRLRDTQAPGRPGHADRTETPPIVAAA